MSKTIYILGAGASYSHSNKEFPLINDIFKVAKESAILVLSILGKNDEIRPMYECVRNYIEEKFDKDILDSRQKMNIEEILTILEIDIEKIKSNDLQIIRDRMISIIFMTFYYLTEKSYYYKRNSDYFTFFNHLKKNDTIITYNWDVLLDNILDRENLIEKIKVRELYEQDIENTSKKQYLKMLMDLSAYRDYHNFRINAPYEKYHSEGYYLKLHGSIDWLYCPNEDCGLYAKVFPIKNINGEYKCHECSSKMKHLIIPPVLNKNYSGFPFIKKLWNIALEELQLADELVIWGYQLPPTDFYNKWLFRQTGDLLKKVSIINPACFHKRKDKKLQRNKVFLEPFLDIFQTKRKFPEISYYENYIDYINNEKYNDKY